MSVALAMFYLGRSKTKR